MQAEKDWRIEPFARRQLGERLGRAMAFDGFFAGGQRGERTLRVLGELFAE